MAKTFTSTLGLFKTSPIQSASLLAKAEKKLLSAGEQGILNEYLQHAGTLTKTTQTVAPTNNKFLKLAAYIVENQLQQTADVNQENLPSSSSYHQHT